MRNFEPYDGDSHEFYKKVVSSKRNPKKDPDYKVRLAKLETSVKDRYLEYDKQFVSDTLPALSASTFDEVQGEDLISLYKFSLKAFVDLKSKLTTTKSKLNFNNCQNCTLSEIGSFDHYVPKELFPEFAVHPKNLVPSCSICNGHKSQNWVSNGERLFLNPYIDKLPDLQFLFINVEAEKDEVKITFTVENRTGIDVKLFRILSSHYSKLYLCNRFADNCADTIDEIKSTLVNFSKKMTVEEVRSTIIETANDNRMEYGFNHFKYLLEIALVESENFIVNYAGLRINPA